MPQHSAVIYPKPILFYQYCQYFYVKIYRIQTTANHHHRISNAKIYSGPRWNWQMRIIFTCYGKFTSELTHGIGTYILFYFWRWGYVSVHWQQIWYQLRSDCFLSRRPAANLSWPRHQKRIGTSQMAISRPRWEASRLGYWATYTW